MPKQEHDKLSVWRGNVRSNTFAVFSKAAVHNGVDSIFSCEVHVQQCGRTAFVFGLSQDLHEVGSIPLYSLIHSLTRPITEANVIFIFYG